MNLNMNAKDVRCVDTARAQSQLELQNDIQRSWCHYAHANEPAFKAVHKQHSTAFH